MHVFLFIAVHSLFVSELAIQSPMPGRRGGTVEARAEGIQDEQRGALCRTEEASQNQSGVRSKLH